MGQLFRTLRRKADTVVVVSRNELPILPWIAIIALFILQVLIALTLPLPWAVVVLAIPWLILAIVAIKSPSTVVAAWSRMTGSRR